MIKIQNYFIFPASVLHACRRVLLKDCFRYLFILSPNDDPSKTMKKCFLFHLKHSFRVKDIQFFVNFSFSFHIQKDK